MQITKYFFVVTKCILVAILSTGVLVGTTLQPPIFFENGPLRCLFDFDEPLSTRNLKLWSATTSRQSSEAYLDVFGTQTDELSRLVFNASDFKVTDAFPDCLIPQNSEYYNPLLRTVHINSKIDHKERSVLFGGRYAFSVNNDAGRIGFRWMVPIKSVTVRRLDFDSVPRGADLQDVLAYSGQIIPRPGETPINVPPFPMMRMDFAEALVQSRSKNPALNLADTQNPPKVGASIISDANLTGGLDEFVGTVQRCLGVVRVRRGQLPSQPGVKNTAIITTVPVITAPRTTPTAAQLAYADGTDDVLPDDGNAEYDLIYRLETTGNPGRYSKLADETTTDIQERRGRQRLKEELWLIPRVYSSGSSLRAGFTEGGALNILTRLSEQVTENAFEFFDDKGYSLDSFAVAGLGDSQIDLFYEHVLSDKCYGELTLGLVIPTAQDSKDFTSPYHTYLGNGKHFEVKLGGSLWAQPLSRLNVKAECQYGCVIPTEETMRASFKGALIKNMGPLINAFVGWNYYVARINATMFHFKTKALSTMLGYEIYYKEKDSLIFPENAMETWQGKKILPDGLAVRNPRQLDESVTTKNTHSIAHRIKFETSMRVTNQCEFSLGFGYSFVGLNSPKTIDFGLVCNVIF
jgi:hypothetical protein